MLVVADVRKCIIYLLISLLIGWKWLIGFLISGIRHVVPVGDFLSIVEAPRSVIYRGTGHVGGVAVR